MVACMTWAQRNGRVLYVALALVLAPATGAEELVMPQTETATFGGGCFWCMEGPFKQLPGVVSVTSGYSGGTVAHPTYEDVSSGRTGHAEVIQVVYDPAKVTYNQLLDVFWRNIDPTDPGGQFADQGSQYRTVIFTHTEAQRQAAEASKQRLAASGKFEAPIATAIEPARPFYAAEDYHQGYSEKNPLQYNLYKQGSGRAGFLKKTWGKDR